LAEIQSTSEDLLEPAHDLLVRWALPQKSESGRISFTPGFSPVTRSAVNIQKPFQRFLGWLVR